VTCPHSILHFDRGTRSPGSTTVSAGWSQRRSQSRTAWSSRALAQRLHCESPLKQSPYCPAMPCLTNLARIAARSHDDTGHNRHIEYVRPGYFGTRSAESYVNHWYITHCKQITHTSVRCKPLTADANTHSSTASGSARVGRVIVMSTGTTTVHPMTKQRSARGRCPDALATRTPSALVSSYYAIRSCDASGSAPRFSSLAATKKYRSKGRPQRQGKRFPRFCCVINIRFDHCFRSSNKMAARNP